MPPVASELEPTPTNEFCVDAERVAELTGTAAATDSTASAGAAATGTSLLDAAAADTAFLEDGATTAEVMLLWRAAAADDEEALLRWVELPSETLDGPATPAPRLGRPGEVDLVDDVEARSEA